jgi:hypothetical protein
LSSATAAHCAQERSDGKPSPTFLGADAAAKRDADRGGMTPPRAWRLLPMKAQMFSTKSSANSACFASIAINTGGPDSNGSAERRFCA